MGDLYKCKKCGQLLYGVTIPEVSGEDANNILNTLERLGYYDSVEPVAFLESDFFEFLDKTIYSDVIRYTAYPSFFEVMKNLHHDRVVVGTKRIEDGHEQVFCSICGSDDLYKTLGNLPTTFVDGRWDDYVISDHTWYIFSDARGERGSFTELERRELTGFINRENRSDVQVRFDEVLQDAHNQVRKSSGNFTRQEDVNLTNYFKVLLNIKTDIQLLETRLYDLLIEQADANREYINSTCRSEETVLSELNKKRIGLETNIARLEEELTFHMREDWAEFYELVEPEEPRIVEPTLPEEPVYKQPGLFNKRAVQAENDMLKSKYEAEYSQYERRVKEKEEKLAAYKEAKEQYETRKSQVFHDEEEAWNNLPENVAKKQELERMQAELAEVKKGMENPTAIAENTLSNSGPTKIKHLFDDEVTKNLSLLKKSYQIEADLQTILFIMPKYLDILAVSKIYEYLITGKCTQLTGTSGAYKMYETEMRTNRNSFGSRDAGAISVLAKREYTIYSMLSSVSNVMNDISNKTTAALDEIRGSTETEAQEEYNRAVDTYYSLIDQEVDICLEFLSLYKKPEPEEYLMAEPAYLSEESKEESASEETAAEEAQEAGSEPSLETNAEAELEEVKPAVEKVEEPGSETAETPEEKAEESVSNTEAENPAETEAETTEPAPVEEPVPAEPETAVSEAAEAVEEIAGEAVSETPVVTEEVQAVPEPESASEAEASESIIKE